MNDNMILAAVVACIIVGGGIVSETINLLFGVRHKRRMEMYQLDIEMERARRGK